MSTGKSIDDGNSRIKHPKRFGKEVVHVGLRTKKQLVIVDVLVELHWASLMVGRLQNFVLEKFMRKEALHPCAFFGCILI